MTGAEPQVSVLIPVFNRRDLVGKAIRSALSQSPEALEVIVGDNHSDDGTWELLQGFRDDRLRVFRNESNCGLFGNFDRCAAEARGEYCIFLCSDDRLAPGFIESALRVLRSAPNAVLLTSRGRLIDADGIPGRTIADRFRPGLYDGNSVVPAWFWASFHYGANPLNYPSGIMLRTAALRQCLPFRAQLGATADIDMFLRILRTGDLCVSDALGCFVMQHSDQEGRIARGSGDLLRNYLALLAEYRGQLESCGIYGTINDQVSCLQLMAALRLAKTDLRGSIELLKHLSRNAARASSAILKSAALIAMDRALGFRRTPFLKRASTA
jgi:hypothetical protein